MGKKIKRKQYLWPAANYCVHLFIKEVEWWKCGQMVNLLFLNKFFKSRVFMALHCPSWSISYSWPLTCFFLSHRSTHISTQMPFSRHLVQLSHIYFMGKMRRWWWRWGGGVSKCIGVATDPQPPLGSTLVVPLIENTIFAYIFRHFVIIMNSPI